MNERSGSAKTILDCLSVFVLFAVLTAFILSFVFGEKVDRYVLFGVLSFVIICIFLIDHTKAGRQIMPDVRANEQKTKELTAAEKAAALERAIYWNTFYRKPVKLSEFQRKVLDDAFWEMTKNLSDMGAYGVFPADGITSEELYTLWFVNKKTAPLFIKTLSGGFIADIGIDNMSAVIPKEVADRLKPFKRDIQPAPEKKKRRQNREAINRQRRAHKDALVRKKAERAKRAAKKPAKKRQAPNYEFYCREWISQNIGYVTKLIANETAYDQKYANALIPIDKLPPDLVTQQLIAKELKAHKVICRYEIDERGMSIRAKTKKI